MKITKTDHDILAVDRMREAINILKNLPKRAVSEQRDERARARHRIEQALELLKE